MSWNALGQAVITKHQQLTSLADTQQQAAQNNLLAENTRLKETVKDLQAKISEMLAKKNQENQRLLDSNKDADMKLFELEQQVQMAQAEKSQTEEEAEKLRQELKHTQDENNKKVNQLTQVANMKKMIVDKNAQLT